MLGYIAKTNILATNTNKAITYRINKIRMKTGIVFPCVVSDA